MYYVKAMRVLLRMCRPCHAAQRAPARRCWNCDAARGTRQHGVSVVVHRRPTYTL